MADLLGTWQGNTLMNKLQPEWADPFPLGFGVRGEICKKKKVDPCLIRKPFGFDPSQRGVKETCFGLIMENAPLLPQMR